MDSINDFLQIQSCFSPKYVGNEDVISFINGKTGVPQLWKYIRSENELIQISDFDRGIEAYDISPSGDRFVVVARKGEYSSRQIFGITVSDCETKEYTHIKDAHHYWGDWGSQEEAFCFVRRQSGTQEFEVCINDHNNTETIYKSEDVLSISSWSSDGCRILIREHQPGGNQRIVILDSETGNIIGDIQGQRNCVFESPCWGPQGDKVLALSNKGSNKKYIVAADVTSHTVSKLKSHKKWNIEEFALEPNSNKLVYSINKNGYSNMYLGDINDVGDLVNIENLDLITGIYGDIEFNRAGDKIIYSHTSSNSNLNVLETKLKTGETNSPTSDIYNIPSKSFPTVSEIQYESFDGLEIPAYYSVPSDHSAPYPAIIDIHGGPESQRRPSFDPIRQYYLHQGFAVFEPNIRGSTGYGVKYTKLDNKEKRLDVLKDVIYANKWLKGKEEIKSDQIVIQGKSYGGLMALLSLVEFPNRWSAGAILFGITDLVNFLENMPEWRRKQREKEYGSLDTHNELLCELSPIRKIDQLDSPIIVIHGEEDEQVPVEEATNLIEQARGQVTSELHIFEDEGHGLTRGKNRAKAYKYISKFFERNI